MNLPQHSVIPSLSRNLWSCLDAVNVKREQRKWRKEQDLWTSSFRQIVRTDVND